MVPFFHRWGKLGSGRRCQEVTASAFEPRSGSSKSPPWPTLPFLRSHSYSPVLSFPCLCQQHLAFISAPAPAPAPSLISSHVLVDLSHNDCHIRPFLSTPSALKFQFCNPEFGAPESSGRKLGCLVVTVAVCDRTILSLWASDLSDHAT